MTGVQTCALPIYEWFDPMTLRDRGYHFIPDTDDEDFVEFTSEPDEAVVNVPTDEDYVDDDDDDDSNMEQNDNHGDEL